MKKLPNPILYLVLTINKIIRLLNYITESITKLKIWTKNIKIEKGERLTSGLKTIYNLK